MINCHRSIASESRNMYVLALRAGQVPCPAVTLAFIICRVATNVSCSVFWAEEGRFHTFPTGSPWPKGEKVSCDELLCLSFFLFLVPARYACAELRVPTGAGFLFIFFVVGAFQAVFCEHVWTTPLLNRCRRVQWLETVQESIRFLESAGMFLFSWALRLDGVM